MDTPAQPCYCPWREPGRLTTTDARLQASDDPPMWALALTALACVLLLSLLACVLLACRRRRHPQHTVHPMDKQARDRPSSASATAYTTAPPPPAPARRGQGLAQAAEAVGAGGAVRTPLPAGLGGSTRCSQSVSSDVSPQV